MTDEPLPDDERDPSTANDDIEERVDDLESQVADISVDDLRDRMASIERQQTELQEHIDRLARRIREEGEEVPHIESVEGLYRDLQTLEETMANVRGELQRLTEEGSDDGTTPEDAGDRDAGEE